MTSVDAHIAKIRKVRYHDYTRSTEITRELEDLLTVPKRPRMPNRLLVGPSNNGKTMLLRRFVRNHPRRENKDGDRSHVPIVVVEVDGPNEGQLHTAILKYLGSPCPPNARLDAKRDQALHQLGHSRVKLLVIDEFHNLLAGPATKQSHFRNVIKLFSNTLQIPIVAAGTELAYNALQADEQLANRFYPLELYRWSEGDDYGRLLLSIRSSWEIELDVDSLAQEILARTNRTIGAIAELLEWAAIWSLRTRGTPIVDLHAIKEYPYAGQLEGARMLG